ncbi:hypothetical protein LCGC14_0422350 [marine sediment metagenome]|uniref:Uncharacterized protein n=1 Tax=marine sediment metagenome TaxID=412755 RepID=A0A0F9SQM5_9ZZZZ
MKSLIEGREVDVCESCEEPAKEGNPLLWMHGPLGFRVTWAFHKECLASFFTNLKEILGLSPNTEMSW